MSDEYLTPQEFSLDEEEDDFGSRVNPVYSDDVDEEEDTEDPSLAGEDVEEEDEGTDDDVFDE